MRLIPVLVILFVFENSNGQTLLEYPPSRKVNAYHEYFGSKINDEYQWLENTGSEEVQNWVAQQNKVSRKYLNKCVSKNNSFNQVDRYSSIKFEYPQKLGKYFFRYMYYSELAVPAIYMHKKINYDPELLVDPNFISRKDKIHLAGGMAVSSNDEYLAYQFSRNGSDWREIKVISLTGKGNTKDHITGVKYSSFAWLGNGFYYGTYPIDSKFTSAVNPKIYYHKLGDLQENDRLIYKAKRPTNQLSISVSSDERFFILKEKDEQNGFINVYYQDNTADLIALRPLYYKFKHDISFLNNIGGKLILRTSYNTNMDYLVKIDPKKPMKWEEITPAYDEAELLYTKPLENKLIAVYQYFNKPVIAVFDYDGNLLKSIDLPNGTSVSGFTGSDDDDELLFDLESYIIPPVIYSFNTRTYEYSLVKKTEVAFDLSDYRFDEIEAISIDSTKIPILLIYKNGLQKNGSNPTLLEAYGGFGAIAQPNFDGGLVAFLEKGGVYAFAHIRGGGDFGYKWWEEGRNLNKKNSFSDFIASSEKLIADGYTRPDKLAITGSSNGGLVVAASMIQRPELFKAVVADVGVYDMLRLEKFTIGQFHLDEYGTVTDSIGFTNLHSYSPLHNIKEEINYPACLIITSDNDDRVPPFHSYKFAAKLQGRESQINPIILQVHEQSGHYGGITKMDDLHEKADKYGFIMQTLTPK